jgi:hypothetical protein
MTRHDASAPAAASGTGRRGRAFTAPQVADWYNFPKADGQGQTVGVIALGGGYRESDLRPYFTRLKLPHPRFTPVSVLGARNNPSGRSAQMDGEVTGDIQTVGALVPDAHIVVYFAPNTERGFLAAVAHAVHDQKWKPSVLSISWGRNEMHWSRRMLRVFDQVLMDAALMGVTVCCSSGDTGAMADALDPRRTSVFRRPARGCWRAAAPRWRRGAPAGSPKPPGTTTRAPAVAASASCARGHAGRADRRRRHTSAAGCPTSRPTPIRTRVIAST